MRNWLLLPIACSAVAVAQRPVDLVCVGDSLFVLEAAPSRIVRVDPGDGQASTTRVLASDSATDDWSRRLGAPTRLVAVGKELIAADARHHRVVAIDRQSGAIRELVAGGDRGPLRQPGGLALHPDGRIAIADTGNRRVLWLARRDDGWQLSPQPAFTQRFAFDVACATDGAVFAIRNFRSVTVWTPDLEAPTDLAASALTYEPRIGARGADRLPSRRRIAADPAGGLLFVESAHHRIRHFDVETGAWTVIAGTAVAGHAGDGSAATAASLRWPTGVAHDAAGNLFVADCGNTCVRRIDRSSGVITTVWGTPRAAALPRTDPDLTVLRSDPDPAVVTDAEVRARIRATGLPWFARHVATGIELVLIPPGRYRRGDAATDAGADPRGDAKPVHAVEISRPFYLGRCEVTNAQYRRRDPRHFSFGNGRQELGDAHGHRSYDGDTQPAINLSWFDCAEYCDEFGLRLPTEAEWEYAARAGATTIYPWGDDLAAGAAWANLANAAHGEVGLREAVPQPFEDGFFLTAPVGSLRPNVFGCHDMIGNAWEWLADWYAADEYERCRHGAVDPRGPASGAARVIRGSSWRSPFTGSPRVAFRGQTRPDAHLTLARGFRVVLDVRSSR